MRYYRTIKRGKGRKKRRRKTRLFRIGGRRA